MRLGADYKVDGLRASLIYRLRALCHGRAAGGLAVVAVAALAVAMVALVYANTSSEWPGSVLMSEGQRTTKLAWGGFTNQMQEEADKAGLVQVSD